jgi:hypothetical protein
MFPAAPLTCNSQYVLLSFMFDATVIDAPEPAAAASEAAGWDEAAALASARALAERQLGVLQELVEI